MWRILILVVIAISITGYGFSLVSVNGTGEVGASAVIGSVDIDYSAYERATDPNYDWQFPKDHGPHPDFLTEWWYYTGNLAAEDGRRFGFQFTIFRRAVLPEQYTVDSEWHTRQIYLAHFTVSDIANEQFYHDTLLSRGAAGLAGATVDPQFRVWIEDWEVIGLDDDVTQWQMRAATDDVAIDFTMEPLKPIVFQGENGLSQKSPEPGNASYYYSMTRIDTRGTMTIEGETYNVEGLTWMDREFSTSALDENAVGWDWFGLILDDNRELMIGQIRQADSSLEPAFGGLFVHPDASTVYLPAESFTIEPTDTWTSNYTGAEYPSGWTITIDADIIGADEPLVLNLTPLMKDQELHTDPSYWEGAVRIDGGATGYGYAELTGYATNMSGRL